MTEKYKLELCWLCPEKFTSRRDLNNHLSTSFHDVLRVTCPFCYEEETTCRRMVDLKKHVDRHHLDKVRKLSPYFFSENNGFWLANKPDDYKKIINPSRRESTEAKEARLEILQLLTINKTVKRKDEWYEGWKKHKEEKKSKKTEIESEFVPSYSPEKPLKVDIININLALGHIQLDIQYGTDFYRVKLTDNTLKDPKVRESLCRKMGTLTNDRSNMVQNLKEEALHPSEELVKVQLFSKGTSILSCYFQKIFRLIHPMTISTTPTSSLTSDSSVQPLSPLISVPVPTSIPGLTSDSVLNSTASLTAAHTLTPILSLTSLPAPTSVPALTSASVLNIASSSTSAATSVTITSSSSTSCPSLPTISPIDSTSLSSMVEDISDEDEFSTNIKSRAKLLLTMGCMPVFPPSRRDWSGNFVKLNENITWPPENHKALTPDQKLLVTEHTAMQLELKKSPNAIPHRSFLLEKYNFLILPGTKIQPPHKKDQHITKSRYYNHEVLKQIALGEIDDEKFLQMMERCFPQRDRSVDDIIKQCKYIPLRLQNPESE
ncbi:uncharacterized protein [Mytilus edulis]|uniref:uncharacterized protein n=1 Tax=Mytilus edulis TaxID=6550 RepID=UPI0039F02E15